MRDATRQVEHARLGSAKRRPRTPSGATNQEKNSFCMRISDPQTDVAPGRTRGRNVRSKNQCSMCPAIHTKSRSWLRSSSTREPSDPLLRVVIFVFFFELQGFPPSALCVRKEKLETLLAVRRGACEVLEKKVSVPPNRAERQRPRSPDRDRGSLEAGDAQWASPVRV